MKNLLGVVAGLSGIAALLCLILLLAGFRPFILTSTSMEPLYPKGSLVWADTNVKLEDVAIGDVLVYRAPSGNLVLHRLVGEGLMQGDANQTAQEVALSSVNYVGREAVTIPVLGELVDAVRKERWIVLTVSGALILLACIPEATAPTGNERTKLQSLLHRSAPKNM